MHSIVLRCITFVHVIMIVFMLFVPFVRSNYLLFLHFILVPLMVAHWFLNDNICIITTIEKKLRYMVYRNENIFSDCVTCRIIDPIFNYQDDHKDRGNIAYLIMGSLWLFSFCHLLYRHDQGKVKSWQHLMVI